MGWSEISISDDPKHARMSTIWPGLWALKGDRFEGLGCASLQGETESARREHRAFLRTRATEPGLR